MKEELKIKVQQIEIAFPTPIAEKKPSEVKEENKQSLIDALTKQSDQFAADALSLKRRREDEKIKFIGGAEYSINDIKKFLLANARPYSPLFPNDNPFFSEIYRLNNWIDRNPNEWIKPYQVPNWINDLIYNRFPKDILPAVQILNPYLPGTCVRARKNFQYFNEDGQNMIIGFRDQSIIVMKDFTTWHEFRLKMVEFGVPYTYQSTMF